VTLGELLSSLRDALKTRPEVRFATLFGSAVTRGPDRARDLDIAFSFNRPISLLELGALSTELERVTGREVDLVDLEDASTLLRWEVLRDGRLILAPEPEAWLAYQTRVAFEWDDLRPYFERESEGLRRALQDKRS
jgi:uncharacterized protein